MNWVKVTDHAGWQPRDSQGELVYKDRMWILGGTPDNVARLADVWHSTDGADWTKATADAWPGRRIRGGGGLRHGDSYGGVR